MEKVKKRDLWKDSEIREMLTIIKEKHVLKLLDSKTKRNKVIFEDVAKEMSDKGLIRSAIQIRAKFKSLKSEYYKIKRNNNKSGSQRQTFEYFDLLDEVLSHRPAITSQGVDTSAGPLDLPDEEDMQFDGIALIEVEDSSANSSARNESTINTFTSTKKQTYQKVVESFSKEWKETQENLVEELKAHDEKYLGIVNKMLEDDRKNTAKILEDDRRETAKMLSSFLTTIQSQTQPGVQFWNPHQFSFLGSNASPAVSASTSSAAILSAQRPTCITVPVSPAATGIFTSTPSPVDNTDSNLSNKSFE